MYYFRDSNPAHQRDKGGVQVGTKPLGYTQGNTPRGSWELIKHQLEPLIFLGDIALLGDIYALSADICGMTILYVR